MRMYIDGREVDMVPDTITWEPPRLLGRTGRGAPVYAPYWTCRLGFSRMTVIQYETWRELVDGNTHTITLPHPTTGETTTFTCYVENPEPRLDTRDACLAAASGVDITLTKIEVT